MKKHGIKQAKYCYIKAIQEKYIYVDETLNEIEMPLYSILPQIEQKLAYPMFVKPANSGSSLGINKVKNRQSLKKAIEYASNFDTKILAEEAIVGEEIECAVIGNEKVEASCLGKIMPAEEFYSYSAKYKDKSSSLIIPVELEQKDQIRSIAIKAFKAIDGKGLSRVDFFVTKEGEIYLNEINTMPGFTDISMYAKLWKEEGISYDILIDKLIELAVLN